MVTLTAVCCRERLRENTRESNQNNNTKTSKIPHQKIFIPYLLSMATQIKESPPCQEVEEAAGNSSKSDQEAVVTILKQIQGYYHNYNLYH